MVRKPTENRLNLLRLYLQLQLCLAARPHPQCRLTTATTTRTTTTSIYYCGPVQSAMRLGLGLGLGAGALGSLAPNKADATHARTRNAFCVFDKRVGDFPQLIYSHLNSQLLFPYL